MNYALFSNFISNRLIMKSLKISLVLLCLVLFSVQLSAQKKFIRLANEAVEALDYNEAVVQFRKALSKNEESSEAIVGLARAYSQLNKFSQAEFYFEKAIKSGDIENPDILDFAMNLLKNKNYDKAKKWFSLLIEKTKTDDSMFSA